MNDSPAPLDPKQFRQGRAALWGGMGGFFLLCIRAASLQYDPLYANVAVDFEVRSLAGAFVMGGAGGYILGAFWDWVDQMRYAALLGAVVGPFLMWLFWIEDAGWRKGLAAAVEDLFFSWVLGAFIGGAVGAFVWSYDRYGSSYFHDWTGRW